ncbi:MAG: hypothetical protein P8P74_04440 [Crocinitomicaceae bacterium]|nr:hypothetical protein [Crocinitomicaceae bacterium]
MKTFNHIMFLSTLLFFASCEGAADPVDEVSDFLAENDQPVSDCSTAPASWFAEVDGKRVTPAPNEGPTSVFANNDSVTNCDFQRWSWQKFLYLTNDTDGKPYFLQELTQVSSVGDTLGVKGGPVILTDTLQASNNVLRSPAQNGEPKRTIFYSIMANDLLLETMKTYGPMVNIDADSTELKGVTYPIGALELKTAWLDASQLGADSSTYYRTNALIDGSNATTRVALLGIHVVGIVENHPEFVWATFEHDELAPMYDWANATHTEDATVTSDKAYPLFAANATATSANVTSSSGLDTDVFTVYDHGVPVEIDADGNKVFMATSQINPQTTTLDNIEGLNSSVKAQLNDIWKNYFLNGSIWVNTEDFVGTPAQANYLDTVGGSLDSSLPNDLTRGSVSAFNITMETYVQYGFSGGPIHDATVSNLVNCFSCHNATHSHEPHSPLKISHLFNGYTGRLKGMTKQQVKQRHIETFRAKAILQQIKSQN